MLALDQVGKSYQGNVALAPLSLDVEEGEKVAVMGPAAAVKLPCFILLAG